MFQHLLGEISAFRHAGARFGVMPMPLSIGGSPQKNNLPYFGAN